MAGSLETWKDWWDEGDTGGLKGRLFGGTMGLMRHVWSNESYRFTLVPMAVSRGKSYRPETISILAVDTSVEFPTSKITPHNVHWRIRGEMCTLSRKSRMFIKSNFSRFFAVFLKPDFKKDGGNGGCPEGWLP